MKVIKSYVLTVGAVLLILPGLPGLHVSDARAQEPYGTPPGYTTPAAPPQVPYVPPPAYTMPAAPPVVVIPGTYIYAVPGINVPVLFYHGVWWRPFEGRWYRATLYNGPWIYVRPRMVPGPLIALSPDYYRRIPVGLPRIPYIELRDNWERWERERHWDRPRERGEEHGERERRFEDR